MAQLSSRPGTPPVLAGFLDLGGIAIPILRLDRLFDLPDQPPALNSHLIILRAQEGPTGILVAKSRADCNCVPGVVRTIVGASRLSTTVRVSTVDIDAKVVHVLSPERILLENERQMLAELQAMAQQRLCYLREAS